MARLNRSWGAEFPDIRGAGRWPVETLLDAVTFVLDQRKGYINFGNDTGYVEAFDI